MSSTCGRARIAVLLILPILLLAGCAQPGGSAADVRGAGEGDEIGGHLTVLAAASLTETFTELAADFERAHPGSEVTLTFGPSSGLAESIVQGAPADVFAAADEISMQRVIEAGDAADSTVFARNRLQIAVPADNPAGVTGLDDFADEDRLIAVCAEEVPCGRAASAAFEAADVTPRPDTYGRDVKAVLTAVRTGEVDAGLVYRTDIRGDDRVEGIDFPESAAAANDYHLSVLEQADDPSARAFTDLVTSPTGRKVLTDAGFEVP